MFHKLDIQQYIQLIIPFGTYIGNLEPTFSQPISSVKLARSNLPAPAGGKVFRM